MPNKSKTNSETYQKLPKQHQNRKDDGHQAKQQKPTITKH